MGRGRGYEEDGGCVGCLVHGVRMGVERGEKIGAMGSAMKPAIGGLPQELRLATEFLESIETCCKTL